MSSTCATLTRRMNSTFENDLSGEGSFVMQQDNQVVAYLHGVDAASSYVDISYDFDEQQHVIATTYV